MVELKIEDGSGFAAVHRPVVLSASWPTSRDPTVHVPELAGPVVLDVYRHLVERQNDGLVSVLVHSAEQAASRLHGWTPEQVRELRSAAWRSAHRFIVDNVALVDRGRELDELAKLLRVKL